jgi:hypothetical protein
MNDFDDPESVRLPLSGGKYVDITKRLTHGETEAMYERVWPAAGFSRRDARTAKLLAYVIGWNLTKAGGVAVPMSLKLSEQIRLDTIRAMNQARAIEIYEAIEAHEAALQAERDAQKKILAGSQDDAAISPSPSVAGGVLSGSALSTSTTT